MTIGFKKRGSLARDDTYLIMHACPRHPPIPRATSSARRAVRPPFGQTSAEEGPSGSSLSEATRRGRAWRWRPRRGRGAKGSNGMGDLTHGLMRARTMLQKSAAKIVRTGWSESQGWQQEVVRGAGWRVFTVFFFLITVLKLLETSTDHFIFNVSEVKFCCCQSF